MMVDTIQKKEHRENEKIKAMGESGENSKEKKQGTTEQKRWSGRTVSHVCHRRSVPLGNVRVEYRSITERCRRMSVPCDG